MPCRKLSYFFLMGGVALLLVSGWLWWEQEQDALEPSVEQHQQPFQQVELHRQQEVTFRLHNPRREAIRLVGVEFT